MNIEDAIKVFSALAQETRLSVFRVLVSHGAMSAGDIALRLKATPSTLSAHLRDLRDAGLVNSFKQGRFIIYEADLHKIDGLINYLVMQCCNGRPEACADSLTILNAASKDRIMSTSPENEKVYNVLFLCTGNSARSIIAEAILKREGQGRFNAFSAGSAPRGEIHPDTISLLQRTNYSLDDLQSKSWDVFLTPDAPHMDFVFTVCDTITDEACPTWPGEPMTANWGIPDPIKVQGTKSEQALAFADTYRMLSNRISIFTSLPIHSLDKMALQRHLNDIGDTNAQQQDSA